MRGRLTALGQEGLPQGGLSLPQGEAHGAILHPRRAASLVDGGPEEGLEEEGRRAHLAAERKEGGGVSSRPAGLPRMAARRGGRQPPGGRGLELSRKEAPPSTHPPAAAEGGLSGRP